MELHKLTFMLWLLYIYHLSKPPWEVSVKYPEWLYVRESLSIYPSISLPFMPQAADAQITVDLYIELRTVSACVSLNNMPWHRGWRFIWRFWSDQNEVLVGWQLSFNLTWSSTFLCFGLIRVFIGWANTGWFGTMQCFREKRHVCETARSNRSHACRLHL